MLPVGLLILFGDEMLLQCDETMVDLRMSLRRLSPYLSTAAASDIRKTKLTGTVSISISSLSSGPLCVVQKHVIGDFYVSVLNPVN